MAEHVIQEGFYTFNTIVADAFMTWRVCVVWDKRAIITTPFVVLNVVTTIFACLFMQTLARIGPDPQAFFSRGAEWRIIAFWTTSFITQSAGTFLIAWRNWSTPVVVSAAVRRSRHRPGFILGIIIDSGAIYSLVVLLTLVTYLRKLAAGGIMGGILGQISTTVPLSIILRERYKEMTAMELTAGSIIVAESHSLPTLRTSNDGVVIQVRQSMHKVIDPTTTVEYAAVRVAVYAKHDPPKNATWGIKPIDYREKKLLGYEIQGLPIDERDERQGSVQARADASDGDNEDRRGGLPTPVLVQYLPHAVLTESHRLPLI
ncbi:hypothetical protein K488DRAFT_90252 [Vararia minispora EC-137]|uniref:Uncharacterized protein n=1 Tax=Vararia minispora EC-137 TaxID=1314806 RepID=A0ACB8Q8I8_9AGAM|nr:hypothetical protein K488DRAFT_90252 [Vararia minispora EC-137]